MKVLPGLKPDGLYGLFFCRNLECFNDQEGTLTLYRKPLSSAFTLCDGCREPVMKTDLLMNNGKKLHQICNDLLKTTEHLAV